MKFSRLLLPAVLGLMCLSSVARDAHAAIITYSDRNVFNSNSTGRTDIAFETAPPSDYTYYGSSANFSGVAFYGQSLYTIDPGFNPIYNYNSGDVLYEGATYSTVFVQLPSNVTAVGLDFMNTNSGANGQLGSFQFTVNGQTFNGTTLPNPNRAFIGFTSDTAITSFSYQSTSGDIALIDNFSYGRSTVVPTPEPSTYAMMALGCIALCVLGAKRKKDGQAI
jgi:hypothetical protein